MNDLPPYDFATGNTNAETFPAEALAVTAAAVIRRLGPELNRYPGKLGHAGLRALMARREMEREGVAVDPEHIFLLNGSMQGVTLMAEALCNGPGDPVVMEEHCYVGTVNAYGGLGLDRVGIPVDGHGMRMDALERELTRLESAGRPAKFIYVLATYQNPTGSMMPRARRLELIAIAKRHDAILVEDNCYADVHFEGAKEPSLYALDEDVKHIYLCSLSKIFAPGVRLGYVIAKPPLLDTLLARRHDAGPNTLAAAIVEAYLRDRLWEHCEMANKALKAKRDTMLEGLEQHLGNTCSWSHPVGGLFIWVRIPDDVDMDKFEEEGAKRGVTFARGKNFYVRDDEIPYIRLAFGYPTQENIRAGMPELTAALNAARA